MDIIDRIGKFFADQEAQLRSTMEMARTSEVMAAGSVTKQTPLRRVGSAPQRPSPGASNNPNGEGGAVSTTPLVRRRFQAVAKLSREQDEQRQQNIFSCNNSTSNISRKGNKSRSDSDGTSSSWFDPHRRAATAWTEGNSDSKRSLEVEGSHVSHSNSISVCTSASGSENTSSEESDGDAAEHLTIVTTSSSSSSPAPERNPEKPDDHPLQEEGGGEEALKASSRRKPQKKKKRMKSASKRHSSQEKDVAARAEEEAKAIKLQEAFAATQERAKRIQMEKLRQQKEAERQKLEQHERLQSQLLRIEQVRRETLRLRPRSAPSTPTGLSSPSSMAFVDAASSVGVVKGLLKRKSVSFRQEKAISQWFPVDFAKETAAKQAQVETVVEDRQEPEMEVKGSRVFMDSLERELRERKSLELTLATRILEKRVQAQQHHAKRENQMRRILRAQELKLARIQQLEQLEKTLQGDLEIVLQQEAASRQERVDAEKQMQRRLKLETTSSSALLTLQQHMEDAKLLEEEIRRTKVAAEARAKAQERVKERISSSSSLNSLSLSIANDFASIQQQKSMMRSVHNKRTASTASSSTRKQSASDNQQQHHEAHQPSLPWETPELAEFEEEGLMMRSAPKERIRRPLPSTPEPKPLTSSATLAMLQSIRLRVQQDKARSIVLSPFRDVHCMDQMEMDEILASQMLSDEEKEERA